MRFLPNDCRWAQWCTAATVPWRIAAALPSTQSSLVAVTMSMIVGTPRPASPTCQPTAPSYSTSADALERLPSLSLSRWIRIALRVPSGSTRGSRKQVSPPGPCARTRNRSHIGAELNHLCPVSRCAPGPADGAGSARVVPARTSEPPCFSVMAMPDSSPALVSGTRRPGSYTREASSGSKRRARSGACRSAGTAAYVIETGQLCPASAWLHT